MALYPIFIEAKVPDGVQPAVPGSAPPFRMDVPCKQNPVPDINGPGGCGGEDLVRLEAVVLPDKRKVPLKPAAVLRCRMATAIADWIRSDMVPIAARLGSQIGELDNFNSYECRGRNRVAGAQLSEHGRANALDLRAVKLVGGKSINFTDRTVPRELRESVLHSVCARFSTVNIASRT